MNVDLLISAVLGGGGVSGILLGILQHSFNRRQNKAEEERRIHEQWYKEARGAYERVSKECDTCKEELRKTDDARRIAEQRSRGEIAALRRELAQVKDALCNRLDAFEEILPWLESGTPMPPEKVAELRSANRALRRGVYKGAP